MWLRRGNAVRVPLRQRFNPTSTLRVEASTHQRSLRTIVFRLYFTITGAAEWSGVGTMFSLADRKTELASCFGITAIADCELTAEL